MWMIPLVLFFPFVSNCFPFFSQIGSQFTPISPITCALAFDPPYGPRPWRTHLGSEILRDIHLLQAVSSYLQTVIPGAPIMPLNMSWPNSALGRPGIRNPNPHCVTTANCNCTVCCQPVMPPWLCNSCPFLKV